MADCSAYLPMLATQEKPPERFDDFAVEAKYDGQLHWTCQPSSDR